MPISELSIQQGFDEFKKILHAAKQESQALDGFNKFITIYKVDSITNLNSNLQAAQNNYFPSLSLSISRGFQDLSLLLIKFGCDVNSRIDCKKSLELHEMTPLHLASELGQIKVVKQLLLSKADIFATNAEGKIPLMKTKSAEVAEILLLTATQQGRLQEFLNIKDSLLGITSLAWACYSGNSETISKLIDYGADLLSRSPQGSIPLLFNATPKVTSILINAAKKQNILSEMLLSKNQYGQTTLIAWLLQGAGEGSRYLYKETMSISPLPNEYPKKIAAALAHAFWQYPRQGQTFAEMRDHLKQNFIINKNFPYYKQQDNIATFDIYTLDFTEAYEYLFKKPYNPRLSSKKSVAIKRAVAQFFSVLHNPELCIKYLEFLSNEYVRYHIETYGTEPTSLDKKYYEYKDIDGYHYPIPTAEYLSDYIPDKKHSRLKCFFVAFLQQFNLAQQHYKWYGFIPKNTANHLVKQGSFFTDAPIGESLFHGDAHVIDYALLACAIDDKQIAMEYKKNNQIIQLDITDVLNYLVVKNMLDDSTSLWVQLIDSTKYTYFAFSGPHQKMTFIMEMGQTMMGVGFKPLSDAFTENFCKGFKYFFNTINQLGYYKTLTMNEVVDWLNDLDIVKVGAMEAVVKIAIEKAQAKQQTFKMIDINHPHAIVVKRYAPNPLFKPTHYSTSQPADKKTVSSNEKRFQFFDHKPKEPSVRDDSVSTNNNHQTPQFLIN